LLQLLCKLLVLLCSGFDDLAKMQKLVEFFGVQEVGKALRPTVFKFNQDFDKFNVVFQLWVDNFDVLLILTQKIFEVKESFLDALGQVADCLALNRADSAVDALSGKENVVA